MGGNVTSVMGGNLKAGRWLSGWVLGLAVLALGASVLRAEDPDADHGAAARAVRLSSIDGQVQISQGGQVLADGAVANTPLLEGSRIVTSDDGRAEIQFEDGSVARISPNSSLTLSVLRGAGTSAEAQLTLEGGLAYFELQGNAQIGAMTVKFGDSVATASGFTVMRVNLDDLPGELAVFSGNAHLDRGGALSVDVHGGESVALSAADVSRYTLNETIAPDSWDAWNSDRDQVLSSEAAAATGANKDYGQSGNPAWNDLDANGNWYNIPGQGNIWSPYDASDPGFDPYGNGYWMDSPGYGSTWISGNSWGYLPYRCGMWNWYESFGWGWAPGSGGCGSGFGAGGFIGVNIGNGYGGYRRPLPPRYPHRPGHPIPLIAVNRHSMAPVGSLPARDKTSVVEIAGYTTQPMRPLSPRPIYSSGGGGAYGYANGTRVTTVGGVPTTGQARTGFVQGGGRAGAPAPVVRSSAAPRSSSSSSHASAPAPSHASGGGGGGGGAAHAGGGGGGAHH